ncbi:383_t:CDS:2 [Funneliformis mosseae]|uniref:383_t:CDS:1 n=1 Tax=Funneliformis mosseae TaxID=27381 RepID=A0A9N9EYW5_FUNMO|nr:383_t:CDS:2 [Funneliformis mosseae]
MDQSTSLCDLVVKINDYIKGKEHFEKFKIERNALPNVGLLILCSRFFRQADSIIKQYLTSIILGKQQLQMNQLVCYDINHIMDWQQLLEIDVDRKEVNIGLREQEQDIQQVLFKSLIKDVQEIVLKVWHIRATGTSEDLPIPNNTFKHLFSIRSMICNPYLTTTKSNKIIYAELFGLSKKVIDLAIKADMYQELSDMFKTFLYDIQNKIDKNQTGDYITNVNNPNITKHKGHLPKRLKSNVEQSSSKGKQVLRNSTHINVIDNNEINAEGEGSGDMINTKGCKCRKCKKYEHFAKTCEAEVL